MIRKENFSFRNLMGLRPYMMLVVIIGSAYLASAQSLQPMVFAADGGSAQSGQIQLDWTLGEVAIEGTLGRPYSYTEGFHQPVLLVTNTMEIPVESSSDASGTDQQIRVLPNPATHQIRVDLPANYAGTYTVQLLNTQGLLMSSQQTESSQSQVNLDVSGISTGLFFVHVIHPELAKTTVFKVIKI